MEKSRSWSSAHDWKSCNRQKRFEGSNPSFSAKQKSTPLGVFFCLPAKLVSNPSRGFVGAAASQGRADCGVSSSAVFSGTAIAVEKTNSAEYPSFSLLANYII